MKYIIETILILVAIISLAQPQTTGMATNTIKSDILEYLNVKNIVLPDTTCGNKISEAIPSMLSIDAETQKVQTSQYFAEVFVREQTEIGKILVKKNDDSATITFFSSPELFTLSGQAHTLSLEFEITGTIQGTNFVVQEGSLKTPETCTI